MAALNSIIQGNGEAIADWKERLSAYQNVNDLPAQYPEQDT